MHISKFTPSIIDGFSAISNYCVKNGVKLSVNLGDFYDGVNAGGLTYSSAKKYYKLVEESISLIPKADGVYHAVMGGNHDKNVARYGFNPIQMLSDARDDIISLGFKQSTLSFHKGSSLLGNIGLHHPSDYGCKVGINGEVFDENRVNDYLDLAYRRQRINRSESFIDIFGHTHPNYFILHSPHAYSQIPPYFIGKGACHLRLYFDASGIKQGIFIPLKLLSKDLIPTGEIVYQKVKSME